MSEQLPGNRIEKVISTGVALYAAGMAIKGVVRSHRDLQVQSR
ncbi:MAG: hypothetical protein WCJ24_01565 [Candidatus Saccharibacteria bacterium]